MRTARGRTRDDAAGRRRPQDPLRASREGPHTPWQPYERAAMLPVSRHTDRVTARTRLFALGGPAVSSLTAPSMARQSPTACGQDRVDEFGAASDGREGVASAGAWLGPLRRGRSDARHPRRSGGCTPTGTPPRRSSASA
jgi:hypothetical protein